MPIPSKSTFRFKLRHRLFRTVASVPAVWLMLGLLSAQATLVRGPMLQGGTTTSIFVLAECTAKASSPMTVNYGPTTAYGKSASTLSVANSSASPVTYVHRIKLTGLQPNTLYHYQLTGQGTTSPDYTFWTLVNAGTRFRFAWSADFRNSSDIGVHGQIATQIRTLHNSPTPPLFDMTGGDYASDNTYASWTNQWLVASELELEKWMCTYLSPGNHDGWATGSNMRGYDQPPDSSGTSGYYGFDCGDMHVTVGNYETTYTSGSAQWKWIQQDLTNSLKPWKVVVFHAPAYTWGGSGAHSGDATFQSMTTSVLEPNGVKVVLAGHNHFYQHNRVNGIRHLTIGGAGAPLYAVSSNATYTVRTTSDNCYLIGDVTPTNLHMAVYNNVGTVLDTIDLYKPAAPTNITTVAGNGQATLNWNRVASATNYTLLYSTNSGGPYPNKKNVTTTNSVVTGLVNGVPYYFVIIASDTNGPSAISAQTLVTPSLLPSIALTAPAAGDRFRAPAMIGLAATVTTNGNTIIKVQFYNFTTNLIGEDLAPPYAYSWTNVSAGNYSVQARLVYNGTLTVNSASANLVVTNLPPVFTGYAVHPAGTFTVSGTGAAGQTYILWAATNLATPVTWLPLATNNADGSGLFYFSDSAITNHPQRFYRLAIP